MSGLVDAANTRAQIVSAIDGVGARVDGHDVTTTGRDTTPVNIQPYDAWPVLVDVRPFTMCASETDWNVYVALPAADQISTVEAGDELAEAIGEALMQIAKVNHIRPMRWVVADGGETPVWQFEITM